MNREDATTVLVVGAGPVGLLTALQLARRGIETTIADPDRLSKNFSYGLALHPATLELLDEVGLANEVIAQGLVVNTIAFYEGASRVGELRMAGLPRRFPFLITLPQSTLEQALERKLRELGTKISWNRPSRYANSEPGGKAGRSGMTSSGLATGRPPAAS